MDLLRGLVLNVAFLFAFLFLLSFPNVTTKDAKLKQKIIKGIIYGLTVVFIIENAYVMQEGAIFDTRSVVISVVALLFSYVTSIITTVFALAYRIYIGGIGVYAGVLTIVSSFLVGIIWKKYVYKKTKLNIFVELYLFGLVVHVLMIVSQFAFPYPDNIEIIKKIVIVVMTLYPVANMLIAKSIINHDSRVFMMDEITKSEQKYYELFYQNPLGMIQFDKFGVINLANQKFADILHTDVKKLLGLDMMKLENMDLIDALKKCLDGETGIFEGYYESVLSRHVFPTRVRFSPNIEDNKVVGGVGIIEDLSEIYASQEKIDELSNYDILTKAYNSITFDKHLIRLNKNKISPVSIAIFDINTFQIINETFGYKTGDQILIHIASVIAKHCDNSTCAYRVGGDEFAMILQNKNNDLANEICKQIKDEIYSSDEFGLKINVSYGLSTRLTNNTDLHETYNNAQKHLQSNKIYDGSSISKKTIDIIMTTLFDKSKREMRHSERVGLISEMIAQELKLGTAFNNKAKLAGVLHDIGKINIDEAILDKPGKLDDSEWIKIKKHPESGFRILNSVNEYMNIATAVLYHHERFDGHGYPSGLKGHNIPLASRIISIADAYDAMTEYRTYRRTLSKEEAIEEINKYKGTQFDPELVDIFINKVIDRI